MILKKEGKNRPGIFMNTSRLIVKHFFTLFFGQSLFLVVLFFMLTPFLHYLFEIARSLSGYSYITLNNMLAFLLHPVSMLVLVFSFLVIGVFFLFQVSFLISFYTMIENGNSPRLSRVFFLAVKRLVKSILHKNFQLLPFIWMPVIVCNVPLLIYIAQNVNIMRYFSKSLNEFRIIIPVFIILFLVLFVFFLRNLFTLHYCMYEGRSFGAACRLSRKIRKGRTVRTFFYITGWNIWIGLISYVIHIITVAAEAVLVICFTDKSLAVATFISINEKTTGYMAICIFFLSLTANIALLTHLFFQYKKEDNEYFYFDSSVESVFLKLKSYKRILGFLGIAFVSLNATLAYNIIRNDTPFLYVAFDSIKITSHRGFSKGVPENTLPAIEKAIEEKADYVEVDIRQTKDKELVLLHDESLKRTTGVNKYIWNLTYEEITLLDAGKWVSSEYAGTNIPSLREVLEVCKGKINMNLDLKDNNHNDALEDSVVALINEYEMENQCVITSTSKTILKNIKALNPNIKTGYITYQIQSIDYQNEAIDFFSINSAFASENLLQRVHEEGKEVLVWTVNTRSELKRMRSLGVDNIITDNPSYAKEILFEDNANHSYLKLLKTMMAY